MATLSVVNDLRATAGPAAGTALYAASARLTWAVGMPAALGAAIVLSVAVRRQEVVSKPDGGIDLP